MAKPNAIAVTSRRIAIETLLPGLYVWEFAARLRDLAGSWPGEFEFPDRYYPGPDGQIGVRFLIPEDMESNFYDLLRSFAEEKGLTFDPSGAGALARSIV